MPDNIILCLTYISYTGFMIIASNLVPYGVLALWCLK